MGSDTLNATFWTMIVLQTIGSVDMPGMGNRKLPAPRAYVAIVVLWGSLSIAADLGQERIANAMAVLVTLTGAVVGPFGQRLASFYDSVGRNLAA